MVVDCGGGISLTRKDQWEKLSPQPVLKPVDAHLTGLEDATLQHVGLKLV